MKEDNTRHAQQRYAWVHHRLKSELIARVAKGCPIKRAAKDLAIPYSNAKKIIKKFKSGEEAKPGSHQRSRRPQLRQIFSITRVKPSSRPAPLRLLPLIAPLSAELADDQSHDGSIPGQNP